MLCCRTKNDENKGIEQNIQREPHPCEEEYRLNVLLHARYKTQDSAVELCGITDQNEATHRLAQEIELTRRLVCGVMQEQKEVVSKVNEIRQKANKDLQGILETVRTYMVQADQTKVEAVAIEDAIKEITAKQAELRSLLKRAARAYNARVLGEDMTNSIVVPPEAPKPSGAGLRLPKERGLPPDEDGHLDLSVLRIIGDPPPFDAPWVRKYQQEQARGQKVAKAKKERAAYEEMLASVELGTSGVATVSAEIQEVVDTLRQVRKDDVQLLLENRAVLGHIVQDYERLPREIYVASVRMGLDNKVPNTILDTAHQLRCDGPKVEAVNRELDEQIGVAKIIAEALGDPTPAESTPMPDEATSAISGAPTAPTGVFEISQNLTCDKPVDELTEAEAKSIIRALPLHIAFDTRTLRNSPSMEKNGSGEDNAEKVATSSTGNDGSGYTAAGTQSTTPVAGTSRAMATAAGERRGGSRACTTRGKGSATPGPSTQPMNSGAQPTLRPISMLPTLMDERAQETVALRLETEHSGPDQAGVEMTRPMTRATRARLSAKAKGKQRAVEADNLREGGDVDPGKGKKMRRTPSRRKVKQEAAEPQLMTEDAVPETVPPVEPVQAATKGKKRARDETEVEGTDTAAGGRKATNKRRKR